MRRSHSEARRKYYCGLISQLTYRYVQARKKQATSASVASYRITFTEKNIHEAKSRKTLTRVGFEPTLMKTTALTLRLRPLGHRVVLFFTSLLSILISTSASTIKNYIVSDVIKKDHNLNHQTSRRYEIRINLEFRKLICDSN